VPLCALPPAPLWLKSFPPFEDLINHRGTGGKHRGHRTSGSEFSIAAKNDLDFYKSATIYFLLPVIDLLERNARGRQNFAPSFNIKGKALLPKITIMKQMTNALFYLPAIFWCSCTFTVEQKSSADENAAGTKTSSKIRNGIELQSTANLKVSQAFLLFDDGSLVPSSNEAKVNQQVNLRLIIEGSFIDANGKVEIGASERIETNTGQLLLDEKDLFHDLGEIEAERAKTLTLNAVITRVDRLYDYFLVSFRVWDKKGSGEISGSYKLHIQ
jgi:hypothetical protein